VSEKLIFVVDDDRRFLFVHHICADAPENEDKGDDDDNGLDEK